MTNSNGLRFSGIRHSVIPSAFDIRALSFRASGAITFAVAGL
jgi:hypothetical protein